MAYKDGGVSKSKGEADARPPVVVIVIVTLALTCPEMELGLNVQAAPAGNPLQLKLMALGSMLFTKNVKLTELPAGTAIVPVTTEIANGELT